MKRNKSTSLYRYENIIKWKLYYIVIYDIVRFFTYISYFYFLDKCLGRDWRLWTTYCIWHQLQCGTPNPRLIFSWRWPMIIQMNVHNMIRQCKCIVICYMMLCFLRLRILFCIFDIRTEISQYHTTRQNSWQLIVSF